MTQLNQEGQDWFLKLLLSRSQIRT